VWVEEEQAHLVALPQLLSRLLLLLLKEALAVLHIHCLLQVQRCQRLTDLLGGVHLSHKDRGKAAILGRTKHQDGTFL